MGRPRTLGPTISLRLPVDVHEYVARRAAAHGQTVAEYLTAQITKSATVREHHPTARPDRVTTYFKQTLKGDTKP